MQLKPYIPLYIYRYILIAFDDTRMSRTSQPMCPTILQPVIAWGAENQRAPQQSCWDTDGNDVHQ